VKFLNHFQHYRCSCYCCPPSFWERISLDDTTNNADHCCHDNNPKAIKITIDRNIVPVAIISIEAYSCVDGHTAVEITYPLAASCSSTFVVYYFL